MPTFRVTCATPGAYFSQLIIEASDGIDAKEIAQKALCDTAAVILVQAVPTDLSPSHLKAIEAILHSHTKRLTFIARKVFSQWGLCGAIVLSLLVFVPVYIFLSKLASVLFPFLR